MNPYYVVEVDRDDYVKIEKLLEDEPDHYLFFIPNNHRRANSYKFGVRISKELAEMIMLSTNSTVEKLR